MLQLWDTTNLPGAAPLIVPMQYDQGGERKRPSSGVARVAAHPRPPKKRKPSGCGTSFCDWIGGICYADTLQVWFPAHWSPVVLQQLQRKEDSYRAENPSWMDQEEAPADILKQWQEVRAKATIETVAGKATFVC